MLRVVIFVSGSGTNMENLIKKMQAGSVPAQAVLVLSDKPGVAALEKAARLGIKTAVVDRKQCADKPAFEREIMRAVDAEKPDYLLLAGFMRILSPEFVQKYSGRILNIHPSYLPAFPGAHAIRDAWEAKVPETGVTVHFVAPEVDAGPVILQRKVPVLAGDTLETLEARVHALEYEVYPEALNLVISGKKPSSL